MSKEDAERTIANVFTNMKLRDIDLKRTNIIPSSNQNDNRSFKEKTKCTLKKSNSGENSNIFLVTLMS